MLALARLVARYNENHRNKKAGRRKFDSRLLGLLNRGRIRGGDCTCFRCHCLRRELVRGGLADVAFAPAPVHDMAVALASVHFSVGSVKQRLGVLSRYGLTLRRRRNNDMHHEAFEEDMISNRALELFMKRRLRRRARWQSIRNMGVDGLWEAPAPLEHMLAQDCQLPDAEWPEPEHSRAEGEQQQQQLWRRTAGSPWNQQHQQGPQRHDEATWSSSDSSDDSWSSSSSSDSDSSSGSSPSNRSDVS
jgi:hypothetical protein